jgi:ribonucleoside-diphosphate reductase beta chain
MNDILTITLGEREFHLDRSKAEEAYSAKKIINGRNSMFFNILPLKYQWAYALYKEMKNEHWEPAEFSVTPDLTAWESELSRSPDLTRMFQFFLGALAYSKELFHSSVIYVVRDLVTAPELKLVFGHFVHEENTRDDVLVFLHGSFEINPMDCHALVAGHPLIQAIGTFVSQTLRPIDRNTDTTQTANKQAVARNIFLINQCLEGVQFSSLWACIFSQAAQNKLPGTGKVLGKFRTDVGFRINLFDQLLMGMVAENPDLWTAEFKDTLVSDMRQTVEHEKKLIESLPTEAAGLDPEALATYVEYLADERLAACELPRQYHKTNPMPWLDEFNGQCSNQANANTSSTLDQFDDDDL